MGVFTQEACQANEHLSDDQISYRPLLLPSRPVLRRPCCLHRSHPLLVLRHPYGARNQRRSLALLLLRMSGRVAGAAISPYRAGGKRNLLPHLQSRARRQYQRVPLLGERHLRLVRERRAGLVVARRNNSWTGSGITQKPRFLQTRESHLEKEANHRGMTSMLKAGRQMPASA